MRVNIPVLKAPLEVVRCLKINQEAIKLIRKYIKLLSTQPIKINISSRFQFNNKQMPQFIKQPSRAIFLPFKIALISLIFLITPSLQWNYNQNGADWNIFHDCNSTFPLIQQSPVDFLLAKPIAQPNIFIFYPQYSPTQYTYTLQNSTPTYKPTSQNFGHLFSLIPSAVHYQNKGLATKIQFHLPSEHLMNGNRAQVQMQIHHTIPSTEFQVSQRNATIVSVFFNITQQSPSPVLSFINNPAVNIDLSLLLQEDYTFTRDIYSYQGTSTQPECQIFSIWYMSDTVEKISQAQYDYLRAQVATSGTAPNGNFRKTQKVEGLILYKHAAWIPNSSIEDRDL